MTRRREERVGGLAHVSLFTGLGGFEYGLILAGIPFRTILYVEINPYRQEIIRQRVRDGIFHDAPLWDDVRTLGGRCFAGKVGLLTAGFPCQPHSTAGRRRGAADPRNLWPDTARLIGEIRPRYALLENVAGLAYPAGGGAPYALTVLADLAALGYDAVWGIVGARDAGAPHRRDRWWCLAYAGWEHQHLRRGRLRPESAAGRDGLGHSFSGRRPQRPDEAEHQQPPRRGRQEAEGGRLPVHGAVGHPDNPRLAGRGQPLGEGPDGLPPWPPGPTDADAWAGVLSRHPELAPAVEPTVRGVADGAAHRRDRLEALGDGIVPSVVAEFLRRVKP